MKTTLDRTRTFRYLTCCVNLGMGGVDDLNAMIENGREITYITFTQHVVREEMERVFPSYEWGYRTDGLRLKNDWAVRYYKSSFRGMLCYYLTHSAIEYIFVERDEDD